MKARKWHVRMVVRDVLASLPEPDQFRYVYEHYVKSFGVAREWASEVADVGEGTEEAAARAPPLCRVFRRDAEGRIFFTEGQILGMLKEVYQALGLTRKLGLPRHWFVEPKRIYPRRDDGTVPTEPDGRVLRPVQVVHRWGREASVLEHERLDRVTLEFDLILALDRRRVPDDLAESIIRALRHVGLGPGRRKDFGVVEELEVQGPELVEI